MLEKRTASSVLKGYSTLRGSTPEFAIECVCALDKVVASSAHVWQMYLSPPHVSSSGEHFKKNL